MTSTPDTALSNPSFTLLALVLNELHCLLERMKTIKMLSRLFDVVLKIFNNQRQLPCRNKSKYIPVLI